MIKKLALNSKPYIRTYTYYGYLHSIISSDDKVSKEAAIVCVNDYDKFDWNCQNGGLGYEIDGNNIHFTANKWNTNMNICFWRNSLPDDEIEIKIYKQLYSNAWGAINIFITGQDQKDMLNDDEYIYRLGNFCSSGIYLRINNEDVALEEMETEKPITIKIVKQNQNFSAYYEKNNSKIELNSWKEKTKQEGNSYRIGFEVKLNNNVYYEWLYSNYINISSNCNSSFMRIDFFSNMIKSYSPYTSNYFIDYSFEDINTIQRMGMSVLEFVKTNIKQGRYIEMYINDKITSPNDYTADFFHQNLIYGYNEIESHLNILMYKNGIPVEKTISYIDFESADNVSVINKTITVCTYNMDKVIYEINPKYLSFILREYCESNNTSFKMSHLFMPNKFINGIAVYDELSTENGIRILLQDIRVSNLLYERSLCMNDRIEYLYYRGILQDYEYRRIYESTNKVYIKSVSLRNIILKNRIKEIDKIYNKIRKHIMEMKEIEKYYLPILIDMLES